MMANVDNAPCLCSKAELELFDTLPINVSMERGDFVTYRPLASLTDASPLEFNVPGSPEDYIDLGRTRLLVKLNVTKADGTAIGATEKVSTVNLTLHSLFSQVDCKLNNKLITPSVLSYPYKAYLETILAHTGESKNSWLSSEMYYEDKASLTDYDPTADNANPGLVSRKNRINQSRIVEVVGRPHVDIFQQDKYLLNGVDMNLRFTRTAKEFHLLADDVTKYKTNITDAVLFIRKVKVNPTLALQHQQTLLKGITAKYPLRRGVVTTFTIPQGNHSYNKENLLTGQLPRRIVLGFVGNKAYNGHGRLNPFNFEHFKLDYLAVNTDNQQFPSQPLRPNFEAQETVQEFYQLYAGMCLNNTNTGINISLEQFMNGYTLFPIDMTPDMAEGAHTDPVKYGNLRLEVHFATALTQPINCICYAEYDNMIQLDQNRNVIADFAPA